jgi:hypothetical protein
VPPLTQATPSTSVVHTMVCAIGVTRARDVWCRRARRQVPRDQGTIATFTTGIQQAVVSGQSA